MKAVLVMLSNYFHDLAVAMLFCSMLTTWYLHKAFLQDGDSSAWNIIVRKVVEGMHKVALAAWAWIIIGGVIRTVNYYDYEWLPAAGRGQITALILKHIFLAAIAIYGVLTQYRLYRLYIKES